MPQKYRPAYPSIVGKSWLAAGTPRNWEVAFETRNIWGMRDKPLLAKRWDKLQEGDEVFFWASAPVSGLIGFGRVRTKFKQDRPLWPEEITGRKVIWPYRFEFDPGYVLSRPDWETARIQIPGLLGLARSGFSPLSEEKANVARTALRPAGRPELLPVGRLHDRLKASLVEVGKMQGYMAESEFPMDGTRLDVVWRRVARSVPTYAFEVQVGGNIYQAIAKLKHAYDLWNSRIYVVAAIEDRPKVGELLSGTFHEIANRLTFMDTQTVEALAERKRAYFQLERQLGLK